MVKLFEPDVLFSHVSTDGWTDRMTDKLSHIILLRLIILLNENGCLYSLNCFYNSLKLFESDVLFSHVSTDGRTDRMKDKLNPIILLQLIIFFNENGCLYTLNCFYHLMKLSCTYKYFSFKSKHFSSDNDLKEIVCG